jgi:2-C-methyl-D-erythritol 2,4-cyclodiphosphate synthase
LKQVHNLIKSKGWEIVNIDSVILAEQPKLKPYLSTMIEKLAITLNIEPEKISIKATTNEKLGPVGREEGIASYAVILVNKV